MKYILTLDNDGLSLLRTLLLEHRSKAFSKVKYYDILNRNGNGDYNLALDDSRKLLSLCTSLISQLKIRGK